MKWAHICVNSPIRILSPRTPPLLLLVECKLSISTLKSSPGSWKRFWTRLKKKSAGTQQISVIKVNVERAAAMTVRVEVRHGGNCNHGRPFCVRGASTVELNLLVSKTINFKHFYFVLFVCRLLSLIS